MKLRAFGFLIVTLSSLGGCQTAPNRMEQARLATAQKIQAEPPGDYFIGRRYFKPDFHFWGYVRRPGPALEHRTAYRLERKPEARSGPRTAEHRKRQQL